MAGTTSWSTLLASTPAATFASIEDLQKYSAADVDPWTLKLCAILCQRFKFASVGYRNIADAFHNLPGEVFSQENFEVGFGSQHVIHILLRSDSGAALAAIVGVLSEYFHEDFVVDFFIELIRKSEVPMSSRPLQRQLKRMVQVLYGVLATSTFGLYPSLIQEPPVSHTDLSLVNVLNAMETMNKMVQTKKRGVDVACGPEAHFLMAVAVWLFDLKCDIASSATTSPAFSGLETTGEADITFRIADTSQAAIDALQGSDDDGLPRYGYPASQYTSGGRIVFERIFQLTFGSAFRSVEDDVLATYLAGTARLMQDNLEGNPATSRFDFLPQSSVASQDPVFGFIPTLLTWFPELHRLSPKIGRFSKLPRDELVSKFVQAIEQIKARCQCSLCNVSSTHSPRICLITMVELVVSLGVYVTRMVVVPRLYPKVRGIWILYNRLAVSRTTEASKSDPVEDFMHRIGRFLPTSVEMLKMGALLFSNSISEEIDRQVDLMGITHAGLTIFLEGGFKGAVQPRADGQAINPVKIRVSPGWMCLFGHEAVMELYNSGVSGWTLEESWEQVGTGRETVQLLKWEGNVALSTIVPQDRKEVVKAMAEGWTPLNYDL